MIKNVSTHTQAVLLALFVTFLWSTSWVLIKIGLQDIPALPFAGLRYALAFLCLLPFVLRHARLSALHRLSADMWLRLAALGLLYYAVTQGAQFLSLARLPAATVNLVLSFTSILVALVGTILLKERPTVAQWGGIGLSAMGALIYFYPASVPTGQVTGLVAAIVGTLANALSSMLGRQVNRSQRLDPTTVTTVSLGIGAGALLIGGVTTQGAPQLTLRHWAIILWLAVVNSALAFTLWNRTLRTLSAMESSIINNTMMIQIPILAMIFLGERLTPREGVGMALAATGTLIVQLQQGNRLARHLQERTPGAET